jgi:hypothetical protein
MVRFLAGAAASVLLVTGAFLLWQGEAQAPALPDAPAARSAEPSMLVAASIPQAPEATPKSREQKRFSRADKDKDGKIAKEELLEPRRKAYAKLDANGNGQLSFDEWAVKTLIKFGGADKDRTGWLTAAEYASTAAAEEKALRLLASGGLFDFHPRQPHSEGGAGAVGVGFLAVGFPNARFGRRHQAEIDVHRLVGVGIGAARVVGEQCTDRGFGRRGGELLAA